MARLAFLGTPEVAVLTLNGLLEAGHEVPLVVSRPDVRRGRGGAVLASPVKQAALDAGVPVTDSLDDLLSCQIDAAIVVAYGRIIPVAILDQLLMINLHFSLLPRWRGAAPVERAILAGDIKTGVCVMKVDPELDAGGIYSSYSTHVGEKTLQQLWTELGLAGTALLVDHLRNGIAGLGDPSPQVGEVTYAKKIAKGELELDFALSAIQLQRMVRLGQAFTFLRGKRVRILRSSVGPDLGERTGVLQGTSVVTAQGSLELLEVQPEGSRVMDASSWVRGLRLGEHVQLGRLEEP